MVLMFVLILNQSKGISFKIPEDELFLGARLVYVEGNDLRYVDGSGAVDTDTPDVLYMAPCANQNECIAVAKQREIKNIRILFPNSLTDEISKISTLAIKSGCAGFSPVVGKRGSIDRPMTLKENPCMASIRGVDGWLDRQGGVP